MKQGEVVYVARRTGMSAGVGVSGWAEVSLCTDSRVSGEVGRDGRVRVER